MSLRRNDKFFRSKQMAKEGMQGRELLVHINQNNRTAALIWSSASQLCSYSVASLP